MHAHYFTPEAKAAIDFVELAPENYAGLGGHWRRRIGEVRAHYPVITHGLAMSIGGPAPLDDVLIDRIAPFIAEIGTPHHSDHLCWSSTERMHTHELLPVEMTRANARRIAQRIKDVASSMPVPMAVENISRYMRHPSDELDEPEFLSEIVSIAGCGVLLDVNNVYVCSVALGFDPLNALLRMPLEATVQIHMAGHLREDDLVIDTHAEPIIEPVYELLAAALPRTGPVPVLLERDDKFPPFSELLAEAARLRSIGEGVFGRA